jgi:hypothetical protein
MLTASKGDASQTSYVPNGAKEYTPTITPTTTITTTIAIFIAGKTSRVCYIYI